MEEMEKKSVVRGIHYAHISEKPRKKSKCEEIGHAWIETTSDQVNICKRCLSVNQCIKGVWRIRLRLKNRRKDIIETATELAGLQLLIEGE